MATRSLIATKIDGVYLTSYCHWDGYPQHHFPILTEHYNDSDKVDALIALGTLSSLDESLETCEAHYRDMDRPYNETRPHTFYTKNGIYKHAKYIWAEYIYIFENDEWHCYNAEGGQVEYVKMKEEIENAGSN